SPTTVKKIINDALRAGFAELTVDRGLLTPVRDALRDTPDYIYSPQELVEYPSLTTSLVEPDDLDGVEVEYIDEFTGRAATITYRLLGEDGRGAENMQQRGVTNSTGAWRLAARHRRTLAYPRSAIRGVPELHALNCRYL